MPTPRSPTRSREDAAAQVEDLHFMLQKEVVQRMAAGPGSKDYGRLSVMLQWRWLDERGFGGSFDLQRRAEEVPVAEFVALAQALPALR